MVDGESIKLTSDQLHQVVNLGIQKAKETLTQKTELKETEKTKEEKKEKDVDVSYKKEIDQLRGQIARSDNDRMLDKINDEFSRGKVDKDFKQQLKTEVFVQISQARGQRIPFDSREITRKVVAKHNKIMEKYQPKIDVKEKEEDKKITQASTSAKKSSGQEGVKPLGRKSFRDGSLTRTVMDALKE